MWIAARGRAAAVLLALALSAAGCGTADTPSAAPSSAPLPSTAVATEPPETSLAQSSCQDDVEQAVCRFVAAIQAGQMGTLSEVEAEAAGAVGEDMPTGEWSIASCELAGDVTVLCELTFAESPLNLAFHVVPVNAEYDDGQLITPNGEPVRYEVEGYLGAREPGTFG